MRSIDMRAWGVFPAFLSGSRSPQLRRLDARLMPKLMPAGVVGRTGYRDSMGLRSSSLMVGCLSRCILPVTGHECPAMRSDHDFVDELRQASQSLETNVVRWLVRARAAIGSPKSRDLHGDPVERAPPIVAGAKMTGIRRGKQILTRRPAWASGKLWQPPGGGRR